MSPQVIRCDVPECPELGDVLVTALQDGTTLAWCFPHYVEAARQIVEAAAAQEAQATDAEAEARLAAAGPALPIADNEGLSTEGIDRDEPDQAADAILAGQEPPEAAYQDQEPDQELAIEPAQVIRRGQSRSRQRHEARRRAATANGTAGEPAPEPGPDDPDDEPDDEPAVPEAVTA